MSVFRKLISIVMIVALIMGTSFSSLGEDIDNGIFLIKNSVTEVNENVEEIETTHAKEFIEETKEGQSIVEYEREKLQEFEEELESNNVDDEKVESSEGINILENVIAEKMSKDLETSIDKFDDEDDTKNISTFSEIENGEDTTFSNNIEEGESVATASEANETKVSVLEENILGSGNHTSIANPRVVINSTYDRYEIYTGENAGVVQILDDNGTYYNSDTNVKVIRDMIDAHDNSPILLKLETNVQVFGFDKENDNYVLLPGSTILTYLTKKLTIV